MKCRGKGSNVFLMSTGGRSAGSRSCLTKMASEKGWCHTQAQPCSVAMSTADFMLQPQCLSKQPFSQPHAAEDSRGTDTARSKPKLELNQTLTTAGWQSLAMAAQIQQSRECTSILRKSNYFGTFCLQNTAATDSGPTYSLLMGQPGGLVGFVPEWKSLPCQPCLSRRQEVQSDQLPLPTFTKYFPFWQLSQIASKIAQITPSWSYSEDIFLALEWKYLKVLGIDSMDFIPNTLRRGSKNSFSPLPCSVYPSNSMNLSASLCLILVPYVRSYKRPKGSKTLLESASSSAGFIVLFAAAMEVNSSLNSSASITYCLRG